MAAATNASSSYDSDGIWLIIDDIIKRFNPLWCEHPPLETIFVQRPDEVMAILRERSFDVLSLDYNLDMIGAGTTQPLVDWLCQPKQVAKYQSMRMNVHSHDSKNAPRIAKKLEEAGYTVTRQSIT